MSNRAMSVIFASDNDSQLNDLSIHRTTASMPFGGRYRLIDFTLSNLVAAGITKVGIITKNNYNSLMDHIRMGRDWDLNRKNGGITVFPPFVLNTLHEVYKGKIDALYSLRSFLISSKEPYVLLTPANIVTSLDFNELENFHFETGADISMLTYKTDELNPKKNIIETDSAGRVIDSRFAVTSESGGPEELINLGIYFIKKDLLITLVDNAYARGFIDFEKDIIQKSLGEFKIMSYEIKDYVAVIDRIPAYFKHSMELLDADIRYDLFYKKGSILTKIKDSVPTRYLNNAGLKNSLVADGCVIDGTVENSILFRGVTVEAGAVVKNSIVMEKGLIMRGAYIDYTITDKNVVIREGRKLAGYETYPMVIAKDKTV